MRTIYASAFLLPLLHGQVTGSLSGRIVDPNGIAVAEASVQVKGSLGTTFTEKSDRDGGYRFGALPPDSYDLTATVINMTAFTKRNIEVGAALVTLDFRMEFNAQLGTIGEDRLSAQEEQRLHHPPAGPAPRMKDGKPDFSGVWWRFATLDTGSPRFLPAAEQIAQERRVNNKSNPQANCLPAPITRPNFMFQIIQGHDALTFLADDDSPGFRVVHLDGRDHPADPNPSWYGHNTARWEDDTLVVDRVAFNDRGYLDMEAHPHSPQLHIIERYRRPDLGHLEAEITVEDPGVLAAPFTMKRQADLAQGFEIYEFVCENERDVAHMVNQR